MLINISFSASTWECIWSRLGSGNWKRPWEWLWCLQTGSGRRLTPIAEHANTNRSIAMRMPQCIMPKQATWSTLKIDYLTCVVVEEDVGVMFRSVRTDLSLEAMSTQFSLDSCNLRPHQCSKQRDATRKKTRIWIINVLFDFTDSLRGFTFLNTYICAIYLLYLLQ